MENRGHNILLMDFVLQLDYEERDLILACINRERWAQQKLYEEYYSKMMGVCIRYAGNESDALDLLHEGFIKVFKYIAKYQPGTSLTAWIRRIMINTCIDHYRKALIRRTEDIDQIVDVPSVDPEAIQRCSEQDILAAVQQLSPVYRTVFNLYAIEGYSHKEISEQLDITESTSRSNLTKARFRLQAILHDLLKETKYGK